MTANIKLCTSSFRMVSFPVFLFPPLGQGQFLEEPTVTGDVFLLVMEDSFVLCPCRERFPARLSTTSLLLWHFCFSGRGGGFMIVG
jgi:hypothetical protein